MGGRASCLQIRKRCETLRAVSMPPSTRRAGRLGRRLAVTDRQGTHADDCWSGGPGHYKCAVRRIERLRDREIPEWRDLWHQDPHRIDAAIDEAMEGEK